MEENTTMVTEGIDVVETSQDVNTEPEMIDEGYVDESRGFSMKELLEAGAGLAGVGTALYFGKKVKDHIKAKKASEDEPKESKKKKEKKPGTLKRAINAGISVFKESKKEDEAEKIAKELESAMAEQEKIQKKIDELHTKLMGTESDETTKEETEPKKGKNKK